MNAHQRRKDRRKRRYGFSYSGCTSDLWASWHGPPAETVQDTVRPLYDAERAENLRAWRTMKGRTLLDQLVAVLPNKEN